MGDGGHGLGDSWAGQSGVTVGVCRRCGVGVAWAGQRRDATRCRRVGGVWAARRDVLSVCRRRVGGETRRVVGVSVTCRRRDAIVLSAGRDRGAGEHPAVHGRAFDRSPPAPTPPARRRYDALVLPIERERHGSEAAASSAVVSDRELNGARAWRRWPFSEEQPGPPEEQTDDIGVVIRMRAARSAVPPFRRACQGHREPCDGQRRSLAASHNPRLAQYPAIPGSTSTRQASIPPVRFDSAVKPIAARA